MPSANTLVRWVNENAFASIVQARPCPTFGRPVHRRGSPHRLRPGTSPHALRIPSHDGHPALRRTYFVLRPASRYSRFWIWHPSSGRQRDFNPPEQCAAQRTIWPLLTSDSSSQRLTTPVAQRQTARSPRVLPTHLHAYACRIYITAFPCKYWALRKLARSPYRDASIRCLFVRPALCLRLPSDPTSRWTPLPFS